MRTGIEKCPQAFGLSLETQRCLLLREASETLRARRLQGVASLPSASGDSAERKRGFLAEKNERDCDSNGKASQEESHLDVRSTARDDVTDEEVRELFEARSSRTLAFALEDISALPDLEGVTHVYSFDAAMEGPLIN